MAVVANIPDGGSVNAITAIGANRTRANRTQRTGRSGIGHSDTPNPTGTTVHICHTGSTQGNLTT